MASKKKQKWDVGDIFLLPLKDGASCIGQVLGREPEALNSVAISLFDLHSEWNPEAVLPARNWEDVFSVILTTKDFLDSGRWAVVAQDAVIVPVHVRSYELLRSQGFVGAKVRGSQLVEDFANAFYGLDPWDDWYLPNYLDDFLLSPSKKPMERLIFSGRHGVPGAPTS